MGNTVNALPTLLPPPSPRPNTPPGASIRPVFADPPALPVVSELLPSIVGVTPQYRVLRAGGVRVTLAGADGRESYVFVRRDVEQLTVRSEELPEENIVEVYGL